MTVGTTSIFSVSFIFLRISFFRNCLTRNWCPKKIWVSVHMTLRRTFCLENGKLPPMRAVTINFVACYRIFFTIVFRFAFFDVEVLNTLFSFKRKCLVLLFPHVGISLQYPSHSKLPWEPNGIHLPALSASTPTGKLLFQRYYGHKGLLQENYWSLIEILGS